MLLSGLGLEMKIDYADSLRLIAAGHETRLRSGVCGETKPVDRNHVPRRSCGVWMSCGAERASETLLNRVDHRETQAGGA